MSACIFKSFCAILCHHTPDKSSGSAINKKTHTGVFLPRRRSENSASVRYFPAYRANLFTDKAHALYPIGMYAAAKPQKIVRRHRGQRKIVEHEHRIARKVYEPAEHKSVVGAESEHELGDDRTHGQHHVKESELDGEAQRTLHPLGKMLDDGIYPGKEEVLASGKLRGKKQNRKSGRYAPQKIWVHAARFDNGKHTDRRRYHKRREVHNSRQLPEKHYHEVERAEERAEHKSHRSARGGSPRTFVRELLFKRDVVPFKLKKAFYDIHTQQPPHISQTLQRQFAQRSVEQISHDPVESVRI